jgi:hypothetical protein
VSERVAEALARVEGELFDILLTVCLSFIVSTLQPVLSIRYAVFTGAIIIFE